MKAKIILAVGSILAAGAGLDYGGECGNSGHIFWQANAPGTQTTLTADDTNLFYTSGTTAVSKQKSGAENWSHDFGSVTPGRVVIGPFTGNAERAFCVGSDGYVYSLDKKTGNTLWSKSLKRQTCSSDTLQATPLVQFRSLSGTNFQATVTNDLIIVGTDYGCSTTTANRVYALDSMSGNVIWQHNATSTYSYDRFSGLCLDYMSDTVYAAAYKPDPTRFQTTLVALNSLNGVRKWAVDIGATQAAPVFANGWVYVATSSGMLYKLDGATGAVIWQTQAINSGALVTGEHSLLVDSASDHIYVIDTAGTIYALLDTCAGVAALWASNLAGATVTSARLFPSSGKLYAGSADGRVYQLNTATGVSESYASVHPGAAITTDLLTTGTNTASANGLTIGNRLLAASGGILSYLCIPWPNVPSPPCADQYAPPTGLRIAGDTGTIEALPGRVITRQLSVISTNCYPFQCVNFLGTLPSGIGLQSLTSPSATVTNDLESFLAVATGTASITVSLSVTSGIPGTYVFSSKISNGDTEHQTIFMTNLILAPTVSVSNPQTFEGNAGATNLNFIVSLNAPVFGVSRVDFATRDDTAIAGLDYAPTNGTLIFSPGETNKVLVVAIIGDNEVEPDEKVLLQLSNPTNLVIGAVSATGTILNDDAPPPTLSILAVSNAVMISWQPETPGFVLQKNRSLDPLTWMNVPRGSANPSILPIEPREQFFRLFKP